MTLALAATAGMGLPLVGAAAEGYEPEFRFHGAILGGYFSDDALTASAGRETQVWKMTRVIFGTDVHFRDRPWSARIELVALGDEVKHKPGDTAYVDYYKNLGTDLVYYGDYPVREAFVRYERKYARVTIGRMLNFHGIPLDTAPYQHRHDAPHAYYIDKELVNGGRLDLRGSGLTLSLGVFGGRGNPSLSYNHYSYGYPDPNIKDNNTPLLESKLSYHYQGGGFSGTIYGGYHRTKTGSAPGGLYAGKHNDERFNAGLDLSFETGVPVLTGFRLLGQYSWYTFGLTEDGSQGQKTPSRSYDLEKNGYFATASIELFDDVRLQYTYERLDRMDTKVWDEVAKLDDEHPSFDSEEINHIYSLSYHGIDNVTLSAFYRQPEFDYQKVSGIEPVGEVDKMGATVGIVF